MHQPPSALSVRGRVGTALLVLGTVLALLVVPLGAVAGAVQVPPNPTNECVGLTYLEKFDFDQETLGAGGSFDNDTGGATDTDPDAQEYTFTSSTGVTISFTTTIDNNDTPDDASDDKEETFSVTWSSTVPVDRVVVKAGNIPSNVINGDEMTNGTALAPTSDTKSPAISHITFCYDEDPLQLNLTAECAVGDTLYWRVTNDEDVAIPFTWDGPAANDGQGVAAADDRTYFTTQDDGGANTTKILWEDGETTKAHNGEQCVYHVSFEKDWGNNDAPDLDGATLLTAESSLGTATCTSDDGALSCVYSTGDDLEVPFGETYTVTENLPDGWKVAMGVGSGFTGIAGFDETALPDDLVYDVADDRYCTSNPQAEFPLNLEKFCTHTVVNEPDDPQEDPDPRVQVMKVFTDGQGDFLDQEPDPAPEFLVELYDGLDTTGEADAFDSPTAEYEDQVTDVTESSYTVTEQPIEGWTEVACSPSVLDQYSGSADWSGTGAFAAPQTGLPTVDDLQQASFDLVRVIDDLPVKVRTHVVCNGPAPQVEVIKVFTDQDGTFPDSFPETTPDFLVEAFDGTDTAADPVAFDAPDASAEDTIGFLTEEQYTVTEEPITGYEEVPCDDEVTGELLATASGTSALDAQGPFTSPDPGETAVHVVCNAPEPEPEPTVADFSIGTECVADDPAMTYVVDVTEGDEPFGTATITVRDGDGVELDTIEVTGDDTGTLVLPGEDGTPVVATWTFDDTTRTVTLADDCAPDVQDETETPEPQDEPEDEPKVLGEQVFNPAPEVKDEQLANAGADTTAILLVAGLSLLLGAGLLTTDRRRRGTA